MLFLLTPVSLTSNTEKVGFLSAANINSFVSIESSFFGVERAALDLTTAETRLASRAFEILNYRPHGPKYLFAWNIFQRGQEGLKLKTAVPTMFCHDGPLSVYKTFSRWTTFV